MLILLSDGAGLTARQCATVLARAGHRVEALSPAGLCLCRMTRHVRRVHDVPALGRDPSGWLEAALDVAARRGADVLLPVQEQVAVMALASMTGCSPLACQGCFTSSRSKPRTGRIASIDWEMRWTASARTPGR